MSGRAKVALFDAPALVAQGLGSGRWAEIVDLLAPELLAEKLPRGREIAAYRRGPYCVYADDAVSMVHQRGLKGRRLDVGSPEWRCAGRPVEIAS